MAKKSPKPKTRPFHPSLLHPRETPRRKAKAQREDDSESSEDSADEADDADWSWKKPEFSQKLLAHIMENGDIKRALYPPCGPNTSTTKGWRGLLGSTTRRWGKTGAGVQNAAEIDMSVTNVFTTKWAEISAKCPWYFNMRNLIGQRPNLVPTGLGHGSSTVTAGVIMPVAAGDAAGGPDPIMQEGLDDDNNSVAFTDWAPSPPPERGSRKRRFDDLDDDGAAAGSGDDYKTSSPDASESGLPDDDVPALVEQKGKGEQAKPQKKPAKPSTSKPAVAAPAASVKPSKKTKLAEFGDIVKNEEKTRHKELDLAALRTCQAIAATEANARIGEKRQDRGAEGQAGGEDDEVQDEGAQGSAAARASHGALSRRWH
ncbi:hypothetical protein B0H14DRAFT_2656078 [Mycena olivaceomarginata]|nr:hypothetical protein B0H14DRAFT_2656078 [Mycena olivaceomarginata]